MDEITEGEYMQENKNKCKGNKFGTHYWISERRVSGAGKIFVTKLDIPECYNCGEKKYVPVVQRTE